MRKLFAGVHWGMKFGQHNPLPDAASQSIQTVRFFGGGRGRREPVSLVETPCYQGGKQGESENRAKKCGLPARRAWQCVGLREYSMRFGTGSFLVTTGSLRLFPPSHQGAFPPFQYDASTGAAAPTVTDAGSKAAVRRQGGRGWRCSPANVHALSRRSRRLHAGFGLGEGPGRKPGWACARALLYAEAAVQDL